MSVAPMAVITERGDPPIDSVWRYERGTVRALIEVTKWLGDGGGYHLDIFLFCNDHHGGHWLPNPRLASGISRLCGGSTQTKKFWELVDKGVLTRVGTEQN